MRWLVLLGVIGLVLLGSLWLFQRKLIYPGAWMTFPVSPPPGPGVEVWEIDTGDGPVEAWVIPGEGTNAQSPGPAVVFLHGNGELIDQWVQELSWYTRRGVTVLLPEYRGYGRSAGRPNQAGITADVRAAVDRLLKLDRVDPDRLIVHGRSLGGGFAAQVVATEGHEPAAVILGSSFTSLPEAAGSLIPGVGWLVRDRLPVRSVLADYAGPVLVLHGEHDTVIPVEHARRNADAAADATLVVYPRTGHNDMPRGHGRWEDIEAFLGARGLLAPSVAAD